MDSVEVLKGRREGLMQALALVRAGGSHAHLKARLLELAADCQDLEFMAGMRESGGWCGKGLPQPGCTARAPLGEGGALLDVHVLALDAEPSSTCVGCYAISVVVIVAGDSSGVRQSVPLNELAFQASTQPQVQHLEGRRRA